MKPRLSQDRPTPRLYRRGVFMPPLHTACGVVTTTPLQCSANRAPAVTPLTKHNQAGGSLWTGSPLAPRWTTAAMTRRNRSEDHPSSGDRMPSVTAASWLCCAPDAGRLRLIYREPLPGGTTEELHSRSPPYAPLTQESLDAALTDVKLLGQLTRCHTGAVARDQAAQVRLVQPVTDPPDVDTIPKRRCQTCDEYWPCYAYQLARAAEIQARGYKNRPTFP